MLSNGNSTPRTFVQINTKRGKFVASTKKADGHGYDKTDYTQLRDVRLIKIEVKDDEFEGTPFRKVQMQMQSDELFQVEFNTATFCAARLIACLAKANLAEPVGLSIRVQGAGSTWTNKDGTASTPLQSDITTVSVWQGDGYIKLEPEEMPPKTAKVMVGKKEVIDSSAREEFVEEKVLEIAAKLPKQEQPAPKPAAAGNSGGFPSAPKGNPGDFEDDIPF